MIFFASFTVIDTVCMGVGGSKSVSICYRCIFCQQTRGLMNASPVTTQKATILGTAAPMETILSAVPEGMQKITNIRIKNNNIFVPPFSVQNHS